jgi:sulfur-carrier protein adenylyltransferase/sulfurtransferase
MVKPGEPREVKVLYPDEARAYLDNTREGTYTLLDVRQPFEYEEAHLPGARLIPLPDLADSLEALNPRQPILVYCAVGGRSRMAAKLLSNQGFETVYQLQGGINAWEAPTATGPVAFHLRFVKGDVSPQRVIGMAYEMEEGLKRFHQEIQSRTVDADLRDLLTQLIKAEESHQRTLLKLLTKVAQEGGEEGPDNASLPGSEENQIEGGVDVGTFVHQNGYYLQSVSGYLELTMMIEAQALDLYLRMGRESRDPVAREVLLQIGEEEKGHLRMLGHFLEKRPRERAV